MQGMIRRFCAIGAVLLLLVGCPGQQTRTLRIQTQPAKSHWYFAPGRAEFAQDGYQPPAQLAVLLPMTGNLAAAAAPVRDGLLAGYYAESRARPKLQFYDTQSTPAGARQALARALADGADQILGPLGREEVAAVLDAPLAVPTLALNSAPPGVLVNNAGSYSLAPEEEGAVLAQYLLARQARRVVVLSHADDTATRSINALKDTLARGSGEVVETIVVGNSASRAGTRLAAVIAEGNVDAICLALRGPQARLLATHLSATKIGERLRVATSQLVQGTGKAQEDRVLDGIVFPGQPWPADAARWPLTSAAPGSDLPTARGAAARLFAFGVDAWIISARLPWLAQRPEAVVSGATGQLRLRADGTVQRTPSWLTFRAGAVVLEE